jgi:hypothetical protein
MPIFFFIDFTKEGGNDSRAFQYVTFSKFGQDWSLKFMRPRNAKFISVTLTAEKIQIGSIFDVKVIASLINKVDE